MNTRIEQAKQIAELSKRLYAEHRKFEAMKEKAAKAPLSKSGKFKADLDWMAHSINKIEASLHALCVDAGLADLREASHYAERKFCFGLGHEHLWRPARPAALAG